MTGIEARHALAVLVRQIKQALMGRWPSEGGMRQPGEQASAPLVAALAAAEAANDTGIDVAAALKELQVAWEGVVSPTAPAAGSAPAAPPAPDDP